MSGYPASALLISRAPPSDSRRENPSFLECQDRVHLLNARRALPDSRGHSLDAPAARIPGREYARETGLQELCSTPHRSCDGAIASHCRPPPCHKARSIQIDAITQPLRVGDLLRRAELRTKLLSPSNGEIRLQAEP
jgi:hypothetical protein